MSSKMSRRLVGGDGGNAHRSCNDGFPVLYIQEEAQTDRFHFLVCERAIVARVSDI
jgi:hypothetical protein